MIDVSRAFLDALAPNQMSQILKDPLGAILLVRVKGFLSCFSEKFKSAARCMKIDVAFGTTSGSSRPELTTRNENSAGNQKQQSRYYIIDPTIVVEPDAIAVLDKIGPKYFEKTGKKFYVNSGTRDALRQADAMYVKASGGDRLTDYKNKKAATEVLAAYRGAKAEGKSRSEITQAMANVIQQQINNKVYISSHLKAGGIDIAIIEKPGVAALSAAEKRIMIEIAKEITGGQAFEEKIPPHIHIQYK